jgi:4-hydroxy-tetrahydrodipicolinate reductase
MHGMKRICIAGATGWAGSALSKGVAAQEDMELTCAVSRKHAGDDLDVILGLEGPTIPIYTDIQSALDAHEIDILVEYTKPEVAKANVLCGLENGVDVIIGTSGLTDSDYTDIEKSCVANGKTVLAVGNFALTVVLLQRFAEIAARFIPNFEIIDYAHAGKKDSPSGSARELAARLGNVRESVVHVTEYDFQGEKESRGVRLDGVQVHSLRLPGHVIGLEAQFGLPDERLSIRHDAGASAQPYVGGALLAIRKLDALSGFHRGLDAVMDL